MIAFVVAFVALCLAGWSHVRLYRNRVAMASLRDSVEESLRMSAHANAERATEAARRFEGIEERLSAVEPIAALAAELAQERQAARIAAAAIQTPSTPLSRSTLSSTNRREQEYQFYRQIMQGGGTDEVEN